MLICFTSLSIWFENSSWNFDGDIFFSELSSSFRLGTGLDVALGVGSGAFSVLVLGVSSGSFSVAGLSFGSGVGSGAFSSVGWSARSGACSSLVAFIRNILI